MSNAVFEYYQKLLLAQYEVSSEFIHKPTLGTVREDFLKDLILNRHKNIVVKSGELFNDNDSHSPQCDSIFCSISAPLDPPNSRNVVMHVRYCKLVLEIKSRLTNQHLKKANEDAEIIKNLDKDNIPLFGVFAYHLDVDRNNLLERFGFRYDENLDSYEIDEEIKLKYPYLDFVMTISTENEVDYQFFLRKNLEDNRFYFSENPAIKNLFALVESFSL